MLRKCFDRFFRDSSWTYPLRMLRSMWLLAHRKNDILALLDQQSFPFVFVTPCPPYLERAKKRLSSKQGITSLERKKQFYAHFSEGFCGENHEASIQLQYESYLPWIPKNMPDPFLDIGCGGGEFLSFLKKNHILAQGVEIDQGEVQQALSCGLDVQCVDAYEFLISTNKKFSGISLFEVIEHIPFEKAQPLLEAAISRLAENGILLVETINLRHPAAFNFFYLDPTHVRPIPDDYLGFLFQWLGLSDVQFIYTGPNREVGDLHNEKKRIYSCFAVYGRKMSLRISGN
jgi:SAM-dependent methyltransferase